MKKDHPPVNLHRQWLSARKEPTLIVEGPRRMLIKVDGKRCRFHDLETGRIKEVLAGEISLMAAA
jgi:hypothetical protein